MEFRAPRHKKWKSFKSTAKRTTFEKLDFSRFLQGQKNEKKYCFPKAEKVLGKSLWNFVLRDQKK